MNNCPDLPCYVYFNPEKCIGCGQCVKSCPTEAIRIKGGKSIHLVDSCIGCGECIHFCPQNCIVPATFDPDAFKGEALPVLFVAPVVYSQFPEADPGDVLAGLRRIGFKHIVDMSYFFELFQWATRRHVLENTPPLPVISTMCPVVLRLIAFNYPQLISHLNPVLRPVSIIVKKAASLIAVKYNARLKDISIFYLNPCPTKMSVEKSAHFKKSPYTSRAIGISQIYPELKTHIKHVRSNTSEEPEADFEFERPPCAEGLMWSISGGESLGTGLDKTLSISGLSETMIYLEKVELGLFKDFNFIEFRACMEGCVGGSLCAVDKYVAQSTVHDLTGRISRFRGFSKKTKDRFYEQKWLTSRNSAEGMEKIFGKRRKALSLALLTEVDKLIEKLPGYSCSACGAPGCRAFAEDVVQKKSSLKECIFYKEIKK